MRTATNLEGCELLAFNEAKRCDEQDKVLETGVEVRLRLELDHVLKVRVVNMRIHAKQALEYISHGCLKGLRKGHI